MLVSHSSAATASRLGRRESVILLAALMALNAIGIDAMLPALPAIGQSLGVTEENQRQLIIVSYMLGFGFGQMLWGPIADRYGRRPIMAIGVSLFIAFSLVCAAAPSFTVLIAARVAMGAASASTRVLVTAIVRDLFKGEAMARVMSLVFMVFMVVPIVAPSFGQAVLGFAPWPMIFVLLAVYAAAILAWGMVRLPETLHPEYRRSLELASIVDAVRHVVGDRLAVGYTLATATLSGALVAYIASIQQIVADVFQAPSMLPLVFAGVATPMLLAAFTNSRIVEHFGLRRVGHAGLIGFCAIAVLHWIVAERGQETLLLFMLLQGLLMISFALCASNFSTLAMTNMGEIAGTAASVQGVASTIGGALIGLVIGQAFDGTIHPFLVGILLCGGVALLLVLVTERGQLLQPLAATADQFS
ncbi:multidrug effflux MFS transporter [Sphingomonas sp.]|uniref:multidrug effflux MFS transporter n=1 Tax=Sphingomonas sp. TaxID=28214 RepID=UPI00286C1AEE|nr:multidrug effflux MFS transporter [Sphingomonas sp.]